MSENAKAILINELIDVDIHYDNFNAPAALKAYCKRKHPDTLGYRIPIKSDKTGLRRDLTLKLSNGTFKLQKKGFDYDFAEEDSFCLHEEGDGMIIRAHGCL